MNKVPEDIKRLDAEIKKIKKAEHLDVAPREHSEYFQASGSGFQISIELFAGTAVGASIGYFLDDLFDSKPFLLIIFLLIGGAAGILNAYRTAKGMEENKKR